MKIVSMDLEMAQPSGRIIQIGACISDLETGKIIDTFNQLVNPHEPLSEFISTLTGITDAAIAEHGVTLHTAYERLKIWLAPHSDRFLNPYVWGGNDLLDLRNQLNTLATDWPFGRRWFDVKTLWQFRQMRLGLKPQAGLAKALVKSGLRFKGRKHSATDDAINTALLATHLYNVEAL